MRAATPARIALGRAGGSIPTAAHLRFRADHARARDAVEHVFDGERLVAQLNSADHCATALSSAATTRAEYITHPDLGRTLSAVSAAALAEVASEPCDVAVVGLSPRAVERSGPPLVDAICSSARLDGWSIDVVTVVSNGRVAIGDEIGSTLGARIVIVLIGERPGLSVSESVGAYLTFDPFRGRTDAQRNCVSNIHERGLSIADAARRIVSLAVRARIVGLTGVGLNDEDATDIDLSNQVQTG
jgi:ethanolamine ammonia-lyase small subunit